MAKIIITKQELWNLGFEKVVIDGVEYVNKAPLLMDSTCPLSLAYCELVEKKKREYYKRQQKLQKCGKGKKKHGKK